jgi:uncharacterized membrane protein
MLPIAELRLALPMALEYYGLPLWRSLFLTISGNFIPAVILVYGLRWVSQFLSDRFVFWAKFFKWLFEHTHMRHTKKFEIWGAVALISFVAIPLPVTGAWTGALASFVFEIDKKKALVYILAGIIIASGIVTGLTLGINKLWILSIKN